MPTQYRGRPSFTIADPSDIDPTARAVDWTGVAYPTASILVANTSTTDAVFLTVADDELVSGRMVGPGQSASFGPYALGVDLWIAGAGTDPVHCSFDDVYSEG